MLASSRHTIAAPLVLFVLLELVIPISARAAAVLPGAEDCRWYQMIPLPGLMSCPDRNRAKGFTGDGTITLAQYQAVTSAPAPALAAGVGGNSSNAQECSLGAGKSCPPPQKKDYSETGQLTYGNCPVSE